MRVKLRTVTYRGDNVLVTGTVDSNHAHTTVSKTALDQQEDKQTFLAVALAHGAGSTSSQPVPDFAIDETAEVEVNMDQLEEYNRTKTIRPKALPETPMIPASEQAVPAAPAERPSRHRPNPTS